MKGYVYAIGMEGTTYVKIGRARSPEARLAALQTRLPFKLELLYTMEVDNPGGVERALHDMFAADHVRGEWFEMPETPLPTLFNDAVRQAGAPGPKPDRNPYMIRLSENVHRLRRKERRSQKDLAAQIGCSPTTISNLEQGKLTAISFEHLLRLAHHFDVDIDTLIGRELERRAV